MNEDLEKLYDKALNFLSFRPRSELEVRRNLRRREKSQEKVDKIIERLKRAALIDDEGFAEWWIEQRRKGKNARGKKLIRRELYMKGVDRNVVDRLVTQLDDGGLVKVIVKERLKGKSRKKVCEYLLRRGFDWEVINAVVDGLN